jgi:hypothetical protein
MNIQLATDHSNEGCKLGREVLFHGLHILRNACFY